MLRPSSSLPARMTKSKKSAMLMAKFWARDTMMKGAKAGLKQWRIF